MVFGQKCMFPKLERGVPGTEHKRHERSVPRTRAGETVKGGET